VSLGSPSAGLAVLALPAVRRALEVIESTDAATVADQVALSEIPAPTGEESARGAAVRERLAALGLADVCTDAAGNVVARWPGHPGEGAVALIAHLDTVFAAGTDVAVRRERSRLRGPGIGDNARGLAGLLAVARAVTRAPVRPRADLLFVASVGEEGLGNLNGVRHLFEATTLGRRITHAIALDGCDSRRIVRRAVGSRRYRVTFRGEGGHSWGAATTPSALHALGGLIARLTALGLPAEPRTTLNVGLAGGGSAVNAVAGDAWCLVEVRSAAERELARLDGLLRDAVAHAAAAERRRAASRPHGPDEEADWLDAEVALLGVRPCGETAADEPLVRAARAATRLFGVEPTEPDSSTDANVPIARGIPAITLGAGGRSGGAHTLDEWYENHGGAVGVQRVLLVTLEVAGVTA
jgi:acetylornithine deacetylase/succinyl-diaminopimelate desuccinylase-like protein